MPAFSALSSTGSLTLRSPLLIAAGGLGDLTSARPEWLHGVGAAITRTIGLRAGGGRPRLEESVAGVLTPRPYPVLSLERALRLAQPVWAGLPAPVIVSLWAENASDFAALAHELAPLPNVAALELHLLGADGAPETPSWAAHATEAALAAGLPVIAKLSPQGNAPACAAAAADAGASALDLGHGRPALFTDGSPAFLCGPAIGVLLSAALLEVADRVALPLIAAGGVASAESARRLLDAGASAVAVGAALLRDPSLAARIATELAATVP